MPFFRGNKIFKSVIIDKYITLIYEILLNYTGYNTGNLLPSKMAMLIY